jgi:beta-phosphoglucomutase
MKKLTLRVKAVIFDMDGVITDTMPYHFNAWKRIFKKEGFKVSECEIYLREGQPGNITVKEIFGQHGVPFDEDRAKRILAEKEKLFKKILRRRFIHGSRPFLHFLKASCFNLALVTGTARHEAERILPRALRDLFDVMITGNDVKKGKPHPEPYLTALKKLQLKPKDAVVIENAPFGIRSAKHAKLACLALETSLPKKYLKGADLVIHSFKQLRQKVSLIKSL